MYDITLISTFHSELGKCNSVELYKIIESLNPEVIFEEMPKKLFDLIYKEKIPDFEITEIRCVKNYLLKHKIKNFPVDKEPNPYLLSNDIEGMFDKFSGIESYKNLKNEQILLTKKEGFSYLNSYDYLELLDRIKMEELKLMELGINNLNVLEPLYILLNEENDIRENAMLENIYNLSRENPYNQAVFLIGARHKKSIIQKVQEYKYANNLNLNWTFYSA